MTIKKNILPFSTVIITLNEEKNIADCIRSIMPICEDIIVVDSQSTDRTGEITKEMGAHFFVQPYLGDGAQKNVGIPHAKYDWIFSLDADERLTPESYQALAQIDFANTPYEAFAIRRKNFIGERWIRHSGWYPNHVVRLFNRQYTKYSEVKGHARVETTKMEKSLIEITHQSFDHVGELFAKAEKFSSRSAKDMFLSGKKANWLSPFFHGGVGFLKKLILQLGFLDGLDGWSIALSTGITGYLKYAKLYDLQRDPRSREKLNIEKVW